MQNKPRELSTRRHNGVMDAEELASGHIPSGQKRPSGEAPSGSSRGSPEAQSQPGLTQAHKQMRGLEGPTGWATTLLLWDWPCPWAWGRLGLMAAWPPGEPGQGLTFSVWGQGWLLCSGHDWAPRVLRFLGDNCTHSPDAPYAGPDGRSWHRGELRHRDRWRMNCRDPSAVREGDTVLGPDSGSGSSISY